VIPTAFPTHSPTLDPTAAPTIHPSVKPSKLPTCNPTTETPTKLPSEEPSQSPSYAPTVAPTQNPTVAPSPYTVAVVQFITTLTIDNVATSELDSKSQTAVVLATAESMKVSPSYVSYVPASSQISAAFEFTSAFQITAQTLFSSPINQLPLGYSDPLALYNTLTSNLQSAVSDNSFTANLVQASISVGASATSNATVVGATSQKITYVTVSPTKAPVQASASSSSSELSGGAIAGIVIAVVVTTILILVAVYYVFCRPPANASYSAPAAPEETEIEVLFPQDK
jgi:hypothetical protein